MDRIEFVVANVFVPAGRGDSVEPFINGVSLVETVDIIEGHEPDWERVRRSPDDGRGENYTGLSPGSFFGHDLGTELWGRRQLLGCGCGVDGCSGVSAEIRREGDDLVVWEDFQSSRRTDLSTLGPFRFERAAHDQAARHPTRRDVHERQRRPPADTTE